MIRITCKNGIMFGTYIDYITRSEAEDMNESIWDGYINVIVNSLSDASQVGINEEEIIMVNNNFETNSEDDLEDIDINDGYDITSEIDDDNNYIDNAT
jgi:hypothetical protein